MKAIILTRVSTKEQEEGHSIAAQRQRLVDYCARKSLKVVKTFELVESSTRGERKEFAAMLEFAQWQKETVAIVADAVDRFQRSFKESSWPDPRRRPFEDFPSRGPWASTAIARTGPRFACSTR
jgi:DNA invertase Pin-like site-specific DNA recombinase